MSNSRQPGRRGGCSAYAALWFISQQHFAHREYVFMTRIKRSVTARARHRKVLARAKGYRGARKNVYRVANQAVMKSGQYAYRDRRQRKRQFRALWIVRINAAARQNGLSYSKFIAGLAKSDITLDRKVLADLAVHDSPAFSVLAEKAKAALAA